MSRLGVEIGRGTLRAVRIGGGPPRTAEVDWDPEAPGEAVADLVETLGPIRAAAVAVDASLLRIRRLALPPLAASERRQALVLESDRYFATVEPLAFSFPEDSGLTFAAPGAVLDRWIGSLRQVMTIDRVEPSTVSLGRALERAGVGDADLLVLHPDGVAWSRHRDGHLVDARHLFGAMGTALDALPLDDTAAVYVVAPDGVEADVASERGGVPLRPAPVPDGLPARFLAAYGAALAEREHWTDGFVTDGLRRDLERRRNRRTVGVALALVATLVFAILSWDAHRDRVEARLDDGIAGLRDVAAPVMALEQDVATLQRSLAALDSIEASRTDVLASLRALTHLMPEDSWLRTIQMSGADWQLQGTASDAAALIPLLDEHPRFEDVRFVAATRRVQTDNTASDDFALAFRTTGPPQRP